MKPTLLSTLTLYLFLSHYVISSTPPNDTQTLTLFRLQTDSHGLLLSNWTGHDACSPSVTWHGVDCSSNNRVISLTLPSLSLRGPIDSLSSLDQLRHLDLHDNRLNGSISPLTSCSNLKLVYLSGNDFSGEIPPEISSLKRLLRLDLSNNNLRGELPVGFSNLTRLLTLRLQSNELSGQVPDVSSSLPVLKEANFSYNELSGRLSDNMLKKFSDRSFAGNAGLCGSNPLPACSLTGDNPLNPGNLSEIVPSNPTSVPLTPDDIIKSRSHKGLRTGATVAIVIATSVITLVLASFLVAYCCRRDNSSNSKVSSESGKRRASNGSEKRVYANAGSYDSDGTTGSDRSKLVFYDRRKQFELEDLLRASAEMLGKGSLGTVYKAVLDDGCVVAVKRLKDANPCGRKEFEQYMDFIGKMKHPNVVRFQAYYYAKEEKLLVYDYLPNGSLYSLLHG